MKVLVLSTNTGGGHNAAGNAIIEALEEMGVRAELVDSLGVASKWGSKAVSDVYNGVAKHAPKLLGAGFGMADKMTVKKVRSASYALNLINVHRLEEFIFAKAPDAIVATHVFCAQALTHLVKHAKIGAMTFGVTTDYNCGIYWEETKMDAYILPHPDLTAAYIAKGMDPQRLYPYGIPVTPKIADGRDIVAAKKKYGINPECKHVIVAGGSMGAGRLPVTVRELDETLPDDVIISAVCGSNKAAQEELAAMKKPRVNAMGYVSPLNDFLASADLVISKAGGLTSTEALAQRIPFIALHCLPPLETTNAKFFEARGMAYNAKNDYAACKAAVKILYDANVQAAFRHAQSLHIPTDASRKIARLIVRSVEQGKVVAE